MELQATFVQKGITVQAVQFILSHVQKELTTELLKSLLFLIVCLVLQENTVEVPDFRLILMCVRQGFIVLEETMS